MTRRKYQPGSGADIVKWARGKMAAISDESTEALQDAAEQGEALTKQYISTRGIDKAGRIDSGDMLNDVGHYVAPRTDGRTQMGFGWIGTKKPYYAYQEGSFFHVGAQRMIPGMFALADAADEVLSDLDQKIGKAIRDA